MPAKQDALLEIVALAKHHEISVSDIANALQAAPALPSKPSSSVLSTLLAYIGGIFVFAGVGVFIGMYWDDFGSAARMIVTLGVGLVAFVMAVLCLAEERYKRAATPLFLIAALLQPTGILVMLHEYASGGDTRQGLIFMSAYMLIQQGATFWAKRSSVLAFGAILFACILVANTLDLFGMPENPIGVVIGFSLLCIAYALQQSRHLAIAPFWYFVGGLVLMWAVFELVEHSPFELLFLGLAALLIFLSTAVRSRALLSIGTLSMLLYIGYYTAEHFANTLGWPIALVVIGVALIALSALAVRLNNKYIKSIT